MCARKPPEGDWERTVYIDGNYLWIWILDGKRIRQVRVLRMCKLVELATGDEIGEIDLMGALGPITLRKN